MLRWKTSAVLLGLFVCGCAAGQQAATPDAATQPTTEPADAYAGPYEMPSVQQISTVLTRVRLRMERGMVIKVPDPKTRQLIPPPTTEPSETVAGEPTFEFAGYPSGVAYAGILAAGEATGDKAYDDFLAKRFQFFADTVVLFQAPPPPTDDNGARPQRIDRNLRMRNPYGAWLRPTSLDSCGAIGAAFIKARRAGVGPDLKTHIDRFAEFVSHKQYRLDDGTVARKGPFPRSLWADDMYMSVPILAQMGALTNDQSYFDDAAKQVLQLSSYLFTPSTGLYTHGWHESVGAYQPRYYWSRANGWCAMATVELLDVLPENHPKRAELIKLLQAHAQGIASTQSGTGLWHQLLDRNDSFLETSGSAMFVYAIANGVNHGWLDADTYAPVAIAGWNGLSTKIDSHGHITGTCVGTSYAMDYPYYYARQSTDDIHGYGPVLLAGSEVIKMLKNPKLAEPPVRGGPIMLRQR